MCFPVSLLKTLPDSMSLLTLCFWSYGWPELQIILVPLGALFLQCQLSVAGGEAGPDTEQLGLQQLQYLGFDI